MIKETRQVPHFEKVKFKDFGTLVLTQGEQESLVVEADEILLKEVITEVRDATLFLGIDEPWDKRIGKAFSSVFKNTSHEIIYTLTCVNLDKISISGKCVLECADLKTKSLELITSGLGRIHFSNLDCDALTVVVSGRGTFSAAGRADRQTIRISGSAEYEAPGLASCATQIIISGQGNALLSVKEELDITISGMGKVNYYGHPRLRQVISGMGKSKRLNNT